MLRSAVVRKACDRARAGQVFLSPSWSEIDFRYRDGKEYAESATIVSADLVRSPRDKRAKLTSVVPFERMTEAQVEVQRRFDAYVAESTPMCMDFLRDVEREGRRRSNRCGRSSARSVPSG